MKLNISDILIIIVIFQLLFTSFFLFTYEKGNRVSLNLLGAFFLSFCLNLTDGFLLLQGVYFDYPFFALWGSAIPLLYGPFLYLYVRSVLYSDFKINTKISLHFLPFLLLTIISFGNYSFQPSDEKVRILHAIVQRDIPTYIYWIGGILYLHFFTYMFISLWVIRKYEQKAADHFSNQQRTNLSWLRSTILFFVLFMMLSAFNTAIGLTSWSGYYYLFLTLLITVFFLYINKVMLKVLKVPGIFLAFSEEDNRREQKNTSKYSGSGLTEGEKDKIAKGLKNLMAEQKPYLQPDLSISSLAESLFVKPKILSQVINEKFEQNFFDFINTYRIEEAKRIFTESDDPKLTILEVLYEVGFNSKSSFNTLFRKQTGLTPTEFRKKYKKS